MNVVVLAGGLGTRLAEETEVRPKPMVEIGGRPLLWHILKHYDSYGFEKFFVALGYKGDVIKRYFLEYRALSGSVTVDLSTGSHRMHEASKPEQWTVHLVDTGLETRTGGRIKRLERWLRDDTFMVTYGDGVTDLDLKTLLAFHRSHRRLATITAVRPPARFGELVMEGDLVARFTEKPQIGEGWINGGFMVFEPGVLNYLKGDDTILEADALDRLAFDGQLAAYRHDGFWQCMDTLRDVRLLEALWQSDSAPWRVWEPRS
ncbi:MAG: glucose-1-phosphate cytidylyltransferase [Chloroflexi bacterium]|nr:glucose-1-phosphate cytidylyltransferase [Chloroflexota bacterium]